MQIFSEQFTLSFKLEQPGEVQILWVLTNLYCKLVLEHVWLNWMENHYI